MKQIWKIQKGVCTGDVMFYSEHSIFAQMKWRTNYSHVTAVTYYYLCSLWVKFRKACMHQFIVSYNNAFRILHGLPMRCSASGMFASSGVNSCQTCIRRRVYSLQCRLHASLNSIVHNIINCDVHLTSSLHKSWLCTLHSNTIHF